jgi:hypothetical protein
MSLRLTDGSRRATTTLVVDVVALAAFVLAGMTSHHETSRAVVFVRNFVPVTVAWFVVALVLPTYRPPRVRWMLANWVVAVPLGLIVRSAIVGDLGESGQLTFFAVALSFTLLFLLIGRAAVAWIERRRAAEAA